MNGSIVMHEGATQPIKLLCVVGKFGVNTGHGGHYYSADTISRQLADRCSVRFINIGIEPASALSDSDAEFIGLGGDFGPKARRHLEKALSASDFKPEVILAFDLQSAMLIRRYCVRKGLGLVMVKAGGAWPRRYYPRDVHQLHFSLGDYERAAGHTRNTLIKVLWVPNRVAPILSNNGSVDNLRRRLNIKADDIVIIRIGRMAESYRRAFLGALALRRFLTSNGYSAKSVVIGVRESGDLAADLAEAAEPGQDHILTDQEFTQRASRFLPLAQINVGVGRGFMEGTSIGQYMFAIGTGDGLPIYCTDDNIMEFLRENFSMRATVNPDVSARERKALEVAASLTAGQDKDPSSRQWFAKWFDSGGAPGLYMKAIRQARTFRADRSLDYWVGEFWLHLWAGEIWIRRLIASYAGTSWPSRGPVGSLRSEG